MTTNRSLWLLLLYFVMLLAPLGAVSIVESTEARYAEAGREMLASGDFLQPRINGIKHFHKPPLAYWMTAAGMRLFGLNDFGVRFFCVVAACLSVLYVRKTAHILLGDARKTLFAALVFSTSILFITLARIASTEIYLILFVTAAQFHLFRSVYGKKRSYDAPLLGLFLGLGFLTKGHIIFAFTLMPYLAAKIFNGNHRKVFRPGEIIAGSAIFLAIALPWYLLVIAENPGLLSYFFKVHTVDRIATDRFHRYQPFWYFMYIFLVTFLPYILFFGKGLVSIRRLNPPVRNLLLFYVALPFVVFSAVKGKHATYIAPLYGAAAIFTAEAIAAFTAPLLRRISSGLLALIAAAPVVAGFFLPALASARLPLAASSALALAMVWMADHRREDDRFMYWTAGCLMFLAAVGWSIYGLSTMRSTTYKIMTTEINRLDPENKLDILVYKGNLPSVSFYRRKLATMALGSPRETQFETDDQWKNTYIKDEDSLKTYLSGHRELFVITHPRNIESFFAEHSLLCKEISHTKRYNSYRCVRKTAADGGI